MEKLLWPSWRYGPDGQAEIFERVEDVPEGWLDHPSKHQPADDPNTASREEVINTLRARGVDFDGRWSDRRLKELLK
jgi:hypothetical protein